MAVAAERLAKGPETRVKTPDTRPPVPIREDDAKRKIWDKVWEAKFRSKAPGWIPVFRIDYEEGKGYIYPGNEEEKKHPGYSLDADTLKQIWESHSKQWKLDRHSEYNTLQYLTDLDVGSYVFIIPTLASPNEPFLVFRQSIEAYSPNAAYLLKKSSFINEQWEVQRLDPRKWKRRGYR